MTHDLKPIRNDEGYAEALAAIEGLWRAEARHPRSKLSGKRSVR
jgi:hypothetical protein